MTKYNDFTGEVSVDFEDTPSLKVKIKEFFDIDLHEKDLIVGLRISAGEYHHNVGRLPSVFLKIDLINEVDLKKEKNLWKVKEIDLTIKIEDFLKLFKRLDIILSPHNRKATP